MAKITTAKKATKTTNLKSMLPLKFMPKNSSKGFSFLVSLNRNVKPAQVTKLAQSINKMGVIRPIVAANFTYNGVKGLYIVDGQHLYHALLRNNMDFPYVEIDISSNQDMVEKIALLNSSSKSWTLQDYIQAWSYINNDYKKLHGYFNTYDLELSQIASILHKNQAPSNTSGDAITRYIKNGTFRIINEKHAVNILDCITDTLKIIPRLDRMSNRNFVSAYVDYMTSRGAQYNHAKFLTILKKHVSELKFVTADKSVVMDFLMTLK